MPIAICGIQEVPLFATTPHIINNMLKKIYSIFACILLATSLNAASSLIIEVHESAFEDAMRLVRKIAPQNDQK